MNTLKSTIFKDDNGIFREHKLFMSAAVLDNKIFFSDQVRNGLYYYDINLDDTKFIGHFENESMTQIDIHRKVIRNGNSLFFMPYYGRNIHIFNNESDSIKYVEIFEAKGKLQHFSNAIKKDGKIYIIPFFLDIPLIEFDIKTCKYEQNNWIMSKINADLLKANNSKTEESYYLDIYNSCLINDKLILSIIGLNMLFICNLDKGDIETIRLNEGTKIRSINAIDGCIYITSLDSRNIIKYDLIKGESRTFRCDDLPIKQAPFTQVVKVNDKIVALAGYMDDSYLLDEETGELRICMALKQHVNRITDDFALLGDMFVDEHNRTYICPRASKQVVFFDGNLNAFDTIDVICDQGRDLEDVMNGYLEDNGFIEEFNPLSLNHFIEFIRGE
ncbi:hypothetical protein [Oribacterium sp. NK2B42]|uniref:hypothetical protein n=1 Tax=Oribacterium sp. NK2B42 TaxID=689781 RepID=UPI0004199604|nr:hypothetical protein [Oribacterium sp. NK2B42]